MAPKKKKSKAKIAPPPAKELPSDLCVFCGCGEKEELGEFLTNGSLAAHHFCMIFSSGLMQSGEDDEGLGGFLPDEILKEVRRSSRLKCTYCGQHGASVGCAVKKCKMVFHYPCGIKNRILFQYFDRFRSFCSQHRDPPIANSPPADAVCSACVSPFDLKEAHSVLSMPCCKNWLHRTCIQAQANSAGAHFFRCPFCNNKDNFQKEMLKLGIYIPDRDASWETESHAFRDLYEREMLCNAKTCQCTGGRRFNLEDSAKWAILLCNCCGAKGTHKACSRGSSKENWTCQECVSIVGTKKPSIKKGSNTPRKHRPSLPPLVKRRKQRLPSPVGRRLSLSSLSCSSPLEEINFNCSVRLRPSDIVAISPDRASQLKRRRTRVTTAAPNNCERNFSPSTKKRKFEEACELVAESSINPAKTSPLTNAPQQTSSPMMSTPATPLIIDLTGPDLQETPATVRCPKCGKKKATPTPVAPATKAPVKTNSPNTLIGYFEVLSK